MIQDVGFSLQDSRFPAWQQTGGSPKGEAFEQTPPPQKKTNYFSRFSVPERAYFSRIGRHNGHSGCHAKFMLILFKMSFCAIMWKKTRLLLGNGNKKQKLKCCAASF